MAILLDPSSALIEWKTTGASASCTVGKNFALLHCGKNANRGAGDTMPAGEVAAGPAINMTASVFMETTAGEIDLGEREFGLVQVTELFAYNFLYAGKIPSLGSCFMDMKAGFTANPSLDVRPNDGQSIDEKILDPTQRRVTPVAGPRRGVKVDVDFGDHPHNAIPLIFENRVAGGDNLLARVSRLQHFIVYFITREKPSAPLVILGRLGWAVAWIIEFNWTAGGAKPTAVVKRSNLFPGQFERGSPEPLDGWAQIAINRTGATANDQDEATVAAVFDQRKSPMLTQAKTRPDELQADFFR